MTINAKTSLQVGPVSYPGRVILAPMAGITDAPFRKVALSFGAPVVVSEMIASDELVRARPEMVKKSMAAGSKPHVVQMAGREAKWLAEGAKWLADSGADVIDINMGCPSKRVTSGYCGAALMQSPEQAGHLVEATVKASSVPVTVKMRLGWDENNLNAPEIARVAVEAGAQAITVHGRTRRQFYKGSADWSKVRAVRDAISVPLLVNGDITDLASARSALEQSGADGVMIGRGSQGRPWITAQIEAELSGTPYDLPSPESLLPRILAHYDDMLDHYGEAVGVRAARKHLAWYMEANLAPHIVAAHKRQIVTTSDPDGVKALLGAAFKDKTPKGQAA